LEARDDKPFEPGENPHSEFQQALIAAVCARIDYALAQ